MNTFSYSMYVISVYKTSLSLIEMWTSIDMGAFCHVKRVKATTVLH